MLDTDSKNKVNTILLAGIKTHKEGKGISPLTLIGLGYSMTKGSQSLAKSTDTWQYSFQSVPPYLEYLTRREIETKGVSTSSPVQAGFTQPYKKSLDRPLRWSGDSVRYIPEFLERFPKDDAALAYKPKWGRFKGHDVSENIWNVPVLAVLYFVWYGEYPEMDTFMKSVNSVECSHVCSISFCLGKPGHKHPYWTEASWSAARMLFSNGEDAVKYDAVVEDTQDGEDLIDF